ncbi:MAG: class I SAM-dependent methyltransferase [Clostridia bacterium]|nr:class I SAM-dependent methyltransferase [Clostridia bacterium]MBR5718694.1 class I SAM-dependent methyltransferase [Clostridia bacterium]
MYIASEWKDYEIIDAGGGDKLERWGNVTLLRPDPQAVWPMRTSAKGIDAKYNRSSSGGGFWEYAHELPESWRVSYRDLTFVVRPTGFKHTGLFPEQAVNWDYMRSVVRRFKNANPDKPFRVLNLFAYTGGASCALAAEGAEVVHVDAAKSIVQWAKANLSECGLSDRPVRFIVDDCMKFVQREARRGHFYEGILMDPPSYGRGPDGEMWRIENGLYPLVEACVKLLSPDASFFLINSYTTGLAPTVLTDVLKVALRDFGGSVESQEVGLPITRDGLVLPCGATGRWER